MAPALTSQSSDDRHCKLQSIAQNCTNNIDVQYVNGNINGSINHCDKDISNNNNITKKCSLKICKLAASLTAKLLQGSCPLPQLDYSLDCFINCMNNSNQFHPNGISRMNSKNGVVTNNANHVYSVKNSETKDTQRCGSCDGDTNTVKTDVNMVQAPPEVLHNGNAELQLFSKGSGQRQGIQHVPDKPIVLPGVPEDSSPENVLGKVLKDDTKPFVDRLKTEQTALQQRFQALSKRLRRLQCRQASSHTKGQLSGLVTYLHASKLPSKTDCTTDHANGLLCSLKDLDTSGLPGPSHFNILAMNKSDDAQRLGNDASRHSSGQDVAGELETFAGKTENCLRHLERGIDSDDTASSSGGESCDEEDADFWSDQEPSPQVLKAEIRWNKDRAKLAARWTWLQAQVSDLEFRIRQQANIFKQFRQNKGQVELVQETTHPNAAQTENSARTDSNIAKLNSNSENSSNPSLDAGISGVSQVMTDISSELTSDCTAARCLPMNMNNFRKRKLAQVYGMHLRNFKAARLSNLHCGCCPPQYCIICTGRVNFREPVSSIKTPVPVRLALLDHSYHQVLAFKKDVPFTVRLGALMKSQAWQQPSYLYGEGPDRSMGHLSKSKKYNRVPKKASAAVLYSNKIKNKYEVAKVSSGSIPQLTTTNPVLQRRKGMMHFRKKQELFKNKSRRNMKYKSTDNGHSKNPKNRRRFDTSSYDIDNIVIPHDIASGTRVERLHYKEILTPSWRVFDNPMVDPPSSSARFFIPQQSSRPSSPTVVSACDVPSEEIEDLSDSTLIIRHAYCEEQEKRRFLSGWTGSGVRRGSRANRRISESISKGHLNVSVQLVDVAGVDQSLLKSQLSASSQRTNCAEGPLVRFRTGSSSSGDMWAWKRSQSLSSTIRCPTASAAEVTERSNVVTWPKRTFPLSLEDEHNFIDYGPSEEDLQILQSLPQPTVVSEADRLSWSNSRASMHAISARLIEERHLAFSDSESSLEQMEDLYDEDQYDDPTWRVQKVSSNSKSGLVLKIAKR